MNSFLLNKSSKHKKLLLKIIYESFSMYYVTGISQIWDSPSCLLCWGPDLRKEKERGKGSGGFGRWTGRGSRVRRHDTRPLTHTRARAELRTMRDRITRGNNTVPPLSTAVVTRLGIIPSWYFNPLFELGWMRSCALYTTLIAYVSYSPDLFS